MDEIENTDKALVDQALWEMEHGMPEDKALDAFERAPDQWVVFPVTRPPRNRTLKRKRKLRIRFRLYVITIKIGFKGRSQ